MSEDYEVGITLALTDDASIGIAAVQRDLLQLDQAMAQSAFALAELRAIASVALKDADVDVRRAAGLAVAPAPKAAARPIKAELSSDEVLAAPSFVQRAPIASAAAVAAPIGAAAPPPVPHAAPNDWEFESTTPVAPVAVPSAASPAAPMAEPTRLAGTAVPIGPSIPPVVIEIDGTRPSTGAVTAAPNASALPNAPLALPSTPSIASAAKDAGFATLRYRRGSASVASRCLPCIACRVGHA